MQMTRQKMMKRTTAQAIKPSAWSGLEQLEARIVLSGSYYDWSPVESLPGYIADYGVPDIVFGASDDGRFMWSEAASDPVHPLETHEPYLVVDGEVRYLRDIPPLADAAIAGINSHGVVFASDVEGDEMGRLFLYDLFGSEERDYLDAEQLDAPVEFDLREMSPLAITDGGGLVLDGKPGGGLELWVVVDQQVTHLWIGASDDGLEDTNAANGVIGTRYNGYGKVRTPMMWTPGGGLIDLRNEHGISMVASLDNAGWVFGRQYGELVFWRQDEVRETGIASDHDPLGTTVFPISANAAGHMIVASTSGYDRGGAVIYSLAGLEGEVRLLNGRKDLYAGFELTESGILLRRGESAHQENSPPGGWYRVLSGAELVRSHAGESATAWTEDGVTVISYRDRFGGVTRTWLDDSGELQWRRTQRLYNIGDSYEERSYVDKASGSSLYLVLTNTLYQVDLLHQDSDGRIFDSFHPIPTITSAPTAFFMPGGSAVIAGFDDSAHLHLYYRPMPQDRAHLSNLSQHLDARGLVPPDLVGGLESFRTEWGAMNIVGLDADGQVHAVWWSPGMGSPLWTTTNLSALSGAPRLVGNLAATATPWGGMQVHGTDERGHLISLWWSPATGEWRSTDLTEQLDGQTLRAGSLDIGVGRFGSINLVGTTEDGEVISYWWSRGQGWEAKPLTEVDGAPRFAGAVSYFAAASGEQHVAGVDDDGHVIDMYWRPDTDGWQWCDLTALAEI